MHRVNVRYADVIAEQQANQFDELDRQMARQRWIHDLLVASAGGAVVLLAVIGWWLS